MAGDDKKQQPYMIINLPTTMAPTPSATSVSILSLPKDDEGATGVLNDQYGSDIAYPYPRFEHEVVFTTLRMSFVGMRCSNNLAADAIAFI